MYEYGEGVTQDSRTAIYWYKQAADQGEAGAQYLLGYLYEAGQGVRQNLETAKEWYGKACDNGYDTGCEVSARINKQGYKK